MSSYPKDFYSTADIADVLQRIADRLRAMPHAEIPSTHVELRLGVMGHTGFDAETGKCGRHSDSELRETVDLLSFALCGDTGQINSDDGLHYGTARRTIVDGVEVDAYTVREAATPVAVEAVA